MSRSLGEAHRLQIREGSQQSLDVRVVPHLVVADRGEHPPRKPGGTHLVVRRRELLEHPFVHQRPVRILGGRRTLLTPPDQVPGVQDEPSAPALDVLHHLASNPVAPFHPKHGATDAWQQLDVLDRSLGDPALVDRQRGHLAGSHERHDHLNQLIGGRVVGELDVLRDRRRRHFLWQDQVEHVDHQLARFGLLVFLVRQIHHRSGIAVHGERESGLRRPRCSWLLARCLRLLTTGRGLLAAGGHQRSDNADQTDPRHRVRDHLNAPISGCGASCVLRSRGQCGAPPHSLYR